ncbi:hypothetical protein Snoj_25430 [Streptomyces nojiriensis]|uniref:Uncharacterized protein n=1 Tax=Streptomyces nojiriensis TaxID=66374 RepID=A0ABQ3SL89_9ACTN|nr:hypothetical protein GCM10010205_69010 [Streptomyces nojiriensis]GHI68625.1 hypothetical protein Snoj_25430 [Streptomyces nojiriensis]
MPVRLAPPSPRQHDRGAATPGYARRTLHRPSLDRSHRITFRNGWEKGFPSARVSAYVEINFHT